MGRARRSALIGVAFAAILLVACADSGGDREDVADGASSPDEPTKAADEPQGGELDTACSQRAQVWSDLFGGCVPATCDYGRDSTGDCLPRPSETTIVTATTARREGTTTTRPSTSTTTRASVTTTARADTTTTAATTTARSATSQPNTDVAYSKVVDLTTNALALWEEGSAVDACWLIVDAVSVIEEHHAALADGGWSVPQDAYWQDALDAVASWESTCVEAFTPTTRQPTEDSSRPGYTIRACVSDARFEQNDLEWAQYRQYIENEQSQHPEGSEPWVMWEASRTQLAINSLSVTLDLHAEADRCRSAEPDCARAVREAVVESTSSHVPQPPPSFAGDYEEDLWASVASQFTLGVSHLRSKMLADLDACLNR